MDIMLSFTQFAQSVLETGEGIFWSFDRPSIGDPKCEWTSELKHLGPNQPDDGFIITDWKGETIFNYQLTVNHKQKLCEDNIDAFWESLPEVSLFSQTDTLGSFLEDSAEGYQAKVEQIQEAQRQGEMWVMNLATQLTGALENLGSQERLVLVLKAYYKLLKSGKHHCGGVIWTPELKCVSFSPEVFLLQSQPHLLQTFPIKGTGTKTYLQTSEKERSELSMVTDLLRNDLAMIGEKVSVPRERFLTDEKHFYHAVAQIQAQIKEPFLTREALKQVLPAGSMTGCPKRRVCEYIERLEAFDRQFYAGTFGIKRGDDMVLGLLIRTLFIGDKHWYYPVGAGITVESDPEREALEVVEKARVLLDFFS